ncbi:hypothetical protein FQN54_003047 [Arachnomyces sp. PD_36]|nr:hypothetical protein FQN54_003047 [Arachnomyces sp. PD_36]
MMGRYFDLRPSSLKRTWGLGSTPRPSNDSSSIGEPPSSSEPPASPIPTPLRSPEITEPTATSSRSHARSQSADPLGQNGGGRTHNRVKFTVGGDDDSDEDEDEKGPISPASDTPPRTNRDSLGGPHWWRGRARQPMSPPTFSITDSEDVTNSAIPAPVSDEQILDEKVRLGNESTEEKGKAIHSAQARAQRLASFLRRPSQRRKSVNLSPTVPPASPQNSGTSDDDEIPMIDLKQAKTFNEDDEVEPGVQRRGSSSQSHTAEAHKLVRGMTRKDFHSLTRVHPPATGPLSGQVTPVEERDPDAYVERPTHYRGGILSTLLKLQDHQNQKPQSRTIVNDDTPAGLSLSPAGIGGGSSVDSSGRATPKRQKWYDKSPNLSTTSLSTTAKHSPSSSMTGGRPPLKRAGSSGGLVGAAKRLSGKPRLEDEIRITIHIAEILSRQRYLMKLCRALMKYGAPTHRLEEYMRMSARVLEIESQFLYIPGCMVISFDDTSTHTTEVKLIKTPQGVDLGRLADTHEIYKEVVHDVVGVEEAMQRLDDIMQRKPKYNVWCIILMYGCASATVGPFAFNARPIDMPIAFILGCLLGILQHYFSPRSDLYSNVFEISAAVLTSFLARAFGSIPYGDDGERLFCFSALAQSAIALILPGYMVLCGSLELQSKSLVAGSVRMVYAIIYSLFLGFGITIGTSIYGVMDKNASSEYTCPPNPMGGEYISRFPFVPLFALCLIMVNQAKWKQTPVMIAIAFVGYLVNFFSAKRFPSNIQIANALGAFAVGLLGNLYSRLGHGLAAAAILPAIFVQVPSGLAASGSLVSGIQSADSITQHGSGGIISNGTQGFADASNSSFPTPGTVGSNSGPYGSVIFDIGYGMVQVAIGITVGLFMAALVVYPFGKRRSGLFSF